MLRAIPELVAYPYPIGYDVVNYYMPMVENFDEHWSALAGQFPLYVVMLHSMQMATGLPAYSVIAAVAGAIFGIFGTTLYYLGRSLLKLDITKSIFLAVFVVFQMAVLRTAWDLHRDIFALTSMMLVFSLLGRNNGWKGAAIVLALAGLTVAADRMIGVLLCISLLVYAAITRRRDVIVGSLFATSLFSALMFASYAALDVGAGGIIVSAEKTPSFYKPQNLMVLFAVVNGLLVVPAAIGFLRMKNHLLKVPLLVAIAGSFSWLAFPNIGQLVADRWIIITGIFLAIFAGYGVLHAVKNLKPRLSSAVAGSLLTGFMVLGMAYAIMSYDRPFVLYGAARASIEDFVPVTMQFNSLDIQDNDKLLSTIAWINQNTEQDAIIVGEKHWRGFMELYLEDERTYRFSGNPQALAEVLERQGRPTYQVTFNSSMPAMFAVEDVAIR